MSINANLFIAYNSSSIIEKLTSIDIDFSRIPTFALKISRRLIDGMYQLSNG